MFEALNLPYINVGKNPYLVTFCTEPCGASYCLLSRKYNDSQRTYCTSEKEALALVLALQHFDFYLSAAQHPISVFTDHNPLTFLNRLKDKNQRLLRWSLILQGYDLIIKHIPGRDNVLADALSRGL